MLQSPVQFTTAMGQKQDERLPFHWKVDLRLPVYLLMLRLGLDRATHKKK